MKIKHALLGLALGGLAGAPGPARAGDPLDDVDGTEGWDQVVQPAPEVERQQRRPDRQAIQREIAQWETVRVVWEQVREGYMLEKARHKKLAREMRSVPSPRTAVEINDDNIDQTTADDDGWGDAPGEQWLVPNRSVDRAIDDELEESRSAEPSPQPAPRPPATAPDASPAPAAIQPPPAPTALTPPEMKSSTGGDDLPDSFSPHKSEQQASGGLAPTAADPDAAMPPAPPQPARSEPAGGDADRGAAAAAEMIERQQEQERRRREEEEARRQAEAEAGAAAAARLLEQQKEQRRREQEALRRKAGVEVDEEGQMVDPDLRREIEAEDDE